MSIVPYSSGFVSAIPPSLKLEGEAMGGQPERDAGDGGDEECILAGDAADRDALSERMRTSDEGVGPSICADDSTKYHRIAEVRGEQGVSLRSVSRRTGIEIRILKQQEDPHSNLTLQQLQVWQRALDVPLSDLLVDNSNRLSQPVQQRAQLVKVMKTAAAIQEVSTSPRVNRLVAMLKEQLEELMPELKEVSAWPNYGQRRAPHQLGKIGEMPIITSHLSLDLNGE